MTRDHSAATWAGIYVRPIDVIGEDVWEVTISMAGHDARRRLYSDRSTAYGFALEEAERLGLPLFDNSAVAA